MLRLDMLCHRHAGSTVVGKTRGTADTWYQHEAVKGQKETHRHVGNF